MTGILADNNVEGHLAALVQIMQDDYWGEVWTESGLAVVTFEDLGLARSASDAVLWQVCQREEIVLLTTNRNAAGPDSLEATIRSENTLGSLPVFTLANAERVLTDKAYAELVAEKFLGYLLDIELYRGSGRLYLP
jgi:hypothetical protein